MRAFVMLGLVFLLYQTKRLAWGNIYPFCVEWDVKPQLILFEFRSRVSWTQQVFIAKSRPTAIRLVRIACVAQVRFIVTDVQRSVVGVCWAYRRVLQSVFENTYFSVSIFYVFFKWHFKKTQNVVSKSLVSNELATSLYILHLFFYHLLVNICFYYCG